MKTTYKFIFILIISMMVSCTAKKSVTQSTFEKSTIQDISIADTKKSQVHTETRVVDQSGDSVQIVERSTYYDTDKPIDQATGRHPVKEETTITTTRIGKSLVVTKQVKTEATKVTHTDNSKIQTSVSEKQKILVIPKPSAAKYYFFILITLAIIAASFIVYKNFNRIRAFLKL